MKRFYREVDVGEEDGGFRVLLDGRAIKTQTGGAQVVSSRALADRLASEWREQGEEIDPASFIFRDLADYAIDVVGADREASITRLLAYAETDTLCYRADPDEAFYRRQKDEWDPLLDQLETMCGARLSPRSGIVHRPQDEDATAQLRAQLETLDLFTLAGLETLASLAASLTVALLASEADADAEQLWDAAELEERWQHELWGSDAEAEARSAKRRAAFLEAAEFIAAARG